MKEKFIINTKTPYYSEDMALKFAQDARERTAIIMMMVGAILVILSFL